MLRKILRDYDYRLSIVWLCIVLGAILAAIFFDVIQLTGPTLLLMFVILGGGECLWSVVRRSSHEKMDRAIDEAEEKRHIDKTRDNPTLR